MSAAPVYRVGNEMETLKRDPLGGLHTIPQTCRIPVARLKGQHSRHTLTREELERWREEREREVQRWLAFLRDG